MDTRLTVIAAVAVVAISALVLRQAFATAWSNRCDPGNTRFFLMKNDPVVSFEPSGAMRFEIDGPDNSWQCADAGVGLYYLSPQVGAVFDETRSNMSANGWAGPLYLKGEDFAVFEKDVNGVRLDAVVQKQSLWVEVDMNAPGMHPGERGF